MKRTGRLLALPLTIVALVAVGWWLVHDVHFDLLQPSGWVGKQEAELLFFTLALSGIVVIPVYTMLVWFAYRYRETNTKAAYRPNWSTHAGLEALWWGIPIAIIAVLGTVAWQTSHSLDPYVALKSDQKPLEVQVVALEWKWLFLYPEQNIATVNQLPVPVNRPVHFTLTSDAPMSSFWVPALGTQIYTMNGMSSELNLVADKVGDMRGYTTNINGRGYSKMTFMVHSLSPVKFDEWVKTAQAAPQVMNTAAYAKLLKPSIIDGERVYRLTDPALYDTVVMKYMMSGYDTKTPVTSTPKQSDTMTHEHSDDMHMEAMK